MHKWTLKLSIKTCLNNFKILTTQICFIDSKVVLMEKEFSWNSWLDDVILRKTKMKHTKGYYTVSV